MTYKIWFQDGSRVNTKCGVANEIDTKNELFELAKIYDFDAQEVLDYGETEMKDDFGLVGGVFKL